MLKANIIMAKKGGFKTDTRWLDNLERDLKNGAQQVVENFARDGLAGARDAAPVALGALRASGYLKTPTESDYESRLDAAKATPQTRVGVRGQTTPEMEPSESPDYDSNFARVFGAWALFDFPLSYSSLIQNGFHHVGAGRRIAGVDFIQAGESRAGSLDKRMQVMINKTMNKHLKKT